MTQRYRLIVFDWDGTLVDSAGKIVAAMDAVTDELGLPRLGGERIRNIIGLGLQEALSALFPERDHGFRRHAVDRYRHYFLRDETGTVTLFPQVEETLEVLKAEGYLLAVATGKSRRGLARDMEATGLTSVFDASRCADEAPSKPHPQMLLEVMAELEVDARNVLMVGDTEYDLAMAAEAGASAAAVTYGVHDRSRLLEFKPRVCLNAMGELPPWLAQAASDE